MSRFFKNVCKLGSATIIAQLLGFLLVPFITRLYAPGDFGTYQIFLSIVTIIGTIACFSYYLAIMLPPTDEEAAHIVVLCFILTVTVAITTSIISWIFADNIEELLNVPGFSRYLVLLPFAIFFYGFYNVINFWMSRKIRFSIIAVSKIVSSAVNKGVQIGWGLLIASPTGLIVGALANDFTLNAVMFKGLKDDLNCFRGVKWKNLRSIAVRYKKFPLLTSWSHLANVASVNVTSFILAFFFNPIIVGYYALAHTVIKLPVKLVGDSLANVFFQKTSEFKEQNGEITNIVQQIHRRLISLGLFPFLILTIIGEELFSLIFGANWATAGLYAQILAPWLFFIFISAPLSNIFYVLERQREDLIFNLLLLSSRVVSLFVGGILGNPMIALILFSITGVAFWGTMNFYILHIAGVRITHSVLELGRFFSLGFIMVIPLIIGKYFFPGSVFLIVLAGIMTLVYYIVVISRDHTFADQITHIVRNTLNKQ